jgi:hypothetical protein
MQIKYAIVIRHYDKFSWTVIEIAVHVCIIPDYRNYLVVVLLSLYR